MKVAPVASVFVLLLLSACSPSPSTTAKTYFNFDSLIQRQVGLVGSKDSLEKESEMGATKDRVVLSLDSVLLKSELDIFKQIDMINRPTYLGMYERFDGLSDSKSNLKVRLLQAKIKSPISFVRFYYQDEFYKLRKIEAVFRESNSLYSTQRNMTLDFDLINGRSLLAHYSIVGGEKMIMSDSVSFNLQGTLLRAQY